MRKIFATLVATILFVNLGEVSVQAVAGITSPQASPSRPTAMAARTTIAHVRPTGPAGRKLPRYKVVRTRLHADCQPGSEAVVGTLRCFSGNRVYVPCWLERAPHLQALCLYPPWGDRVIRLRITQFGGYPPNHGGHFAWGLRLANGAQCSAVQGTHDTFHGRPVDYYCNHHVAVLRGINRHHQPWLVHTVTYDSSFNYHRGPVRKVLRAFIGLKSWQPRHE